MNLLFKGDALDFDEDGYYATLLDLHRRKNLAITGKGDGNGVEIRVLSSANLDPYEQRVLTFIDQIADESVLDTEKIAAIAKQAQSDSGAEEIALRYQRNLTDVTSRVDTRLSLQYMVDGRDHITPLGMVAGVMLCVTVILAIVCSMQSYILFPAALSGVWSSSRRGLPLPPRPRCSATGRTTTIKKNWSGMHSPVSSLIWQ